jgi:hypothetical protein
MIVVAGSDQLALPLCVSLITFGPLAFGQMTHSTRVMYNESGTWQESFPPAFKPAQI